MYVSMLNTDYRKEITCACPMCGRHTKLRLTAEEVNAYWDYADGKGLIQDLFPNKSPAEREILKTGYCYPCQEELFGIKID